MEDAAAIAEAAVKLYITYMIDGDAAPTQTVLSAFWGGNCVVTSEHGLPRNEKILKAMSGMSEFSDPKVPHMCLASSFLNSKEPGMFLIRNRLFML